MAAPYSPDRVSPENAVPVGVWGRLAPRVLRLSQINPDKSANDWRSQPGITGQNSKVWTDKVILKSQDWGWKEIQLRSKLVAEEAFNNVWKL